MPTTFFVIQPKFLWDGCVSGTGGFFRFAAHSVRSAKLVAWPSHLERWLQAGGVNPLTRLAGQSPR
jgi:hypothetical protein